jgi:hypothetical protein
MRCKRGQHREIPISLIIAGLVLALFVFAVVGFILGWWEGTLEAIKNFFRFGR